MHLLMITCDEIILEIIRIKNNLKNVIIIFIVAVEDEKGNKQKYTYKCN